MKRLSVQEGVMDGEKQAVLAALTRSAESAAAKTGNKTKTRSCN